MNANIDLHAKASEYVRLPARETNNARYARTSVRCHGGHVVVLGCDNRRIFAIVSGNVICDNYISLELYNLLPD